MAVNIASSSDHGRFERSLPCLMSGTTKRELNDFICANASWSTTRGSDSSPQPSARSVGASAANSPIS